MPDPIFACLEAHKWAWAHLLETEIHTRDDTALDKAARAADLALEEITATPPTTLTGMPAVIEYLVGLDVHADYLPTLLRSSILRSPVLA